MAFVAGPYTATFAASSIGTIEEGFDLETTPQKDLIAGSNLGTTVQDGAYLGGDVFISFTLMEPDLAAVASILWPYGSLGAIGQVGRLDSNIAAALVLTAVAGTTAADGIASLTASRAILAENFPVRLLFAPRARRVPIRMRLYPFGSAGSETHYTTT